VVRAFRRALRGFFRHQGFFLAAGLSFFFLICLVPLLFLAVSVAGFVLSSETAARRVIGQLAQIIPVYQREITRSLLGIVAARRLSGILGTVILVLFSTQLFAAIRLVLNRVLGIRGRGFWRGPTFDVAMIVLITPFFLATIAVTDLFTWFKVAVFRPARIPRFLVELMGIGLGVLFSTTMFFFIYYFVPRRTVPPRVALAGALLTSLLWEVAKQLFRLYIVNVGVYGQIYGPLGVLVALVMFVYYSATIFVLGAEFIRSLKDGGASPRPSAG
jgi:membrane protein